MRYIIVMPAFNEEEKIGTTLDSIVEQSLLPQALIVVDDGSTDRTAQIGEQYTQQYPWIRLVQNKVKAEHQPGAKIIRAFYKGFETVATDYDVIVKLDADQVLPPHYFSRVMEMFESDPAIGMAGGVHVVERNGQWVYENYADRDHIRGAFKAYRKECFEAIGGLRESLGWDTVDELLALFNGWQVKTDENLRVKHLRARGTSTGFVKVMMKVGRAMYRMRYGFVVALTSAIKAGLVNKPYILTGLAVIWGWLNAWVNQEPFIVNKKEGRFIRRFRWQRMKEKLGGISERIR